MQTLEGFFEEAFATLPTKAEDRITLNAARCGSPPAELETARLKVVGWQLGHSYGDSARYDVVHFFADQETYRRLGLLLLAAVFHPNCQITLHLQHPEATVAKLRIECWAADPLAPTLHGLAVTPSAYGYVAAPVAHRYPLHAEDWRIEGISRDSARAALPLPFFDFTNEHGRSGSAESFAARNVVEGFGGPEATATLGALLLDIGLPETKLTEFSLESPSGNWSVAIGSAEARFWIGYDSLANR